MALIEINRDPSVRELRQFAGIWVPLFCALVGGLVWYYDGSFAVAAAIWTLGAALSVIGLFRPPLLRPVFVGWLYAAYPVGWAVSYSLLALFFFFIITPIGLLLRLFGYNPLKRRFDRAAETYWVAYNPAGDLARYFRQF